MTVNLSAHDLNVLEKIKDPESDPRQRTMVNPGLPHDPHIQDQRLYFALVQHEQELINKLMKIEAVIYQPAASRTHAKVPDDYRGVLAKFNSIISKHPKYASAQNNRAQAIRRLFGDSILVDGPLDPAAIARPHEPVERRESAALLLRDLNRCIMLLSPQTPKSPISPQAARTLAAAHTQRAALFHRTARLLAEGRKLDLHPAVFRELASWRGFDFEEAASRDFAWGGRYGNEIAKALAVRVNPTAKLCGEIVRGAMKSEYGDSIAW